MRTSKNKFFYWKAIFSLINIDFFASQRGFLYDSQRLFHILALISTGVCTLKQQKGNNTIRSGKVTNFYFTTMFSLLSQMKA
jgi:hypothetical protein